MIITLFFVLVFVFQLKNTVLEKRKIISIVALLVYISLTLFDLYWIKSFNNICFHFSDPTAYYQKTKGIFFYQVFLIDSTNLFYYVINWYYNALYENPVFISFFLKINNALLYSCCYLIVSRKLSKISFVDYLLLFINIKLFTI